MQRPILTTCAGADTARLEELYLGNYDRVYAYLHVLLRDRHEAEDATQSVFASVLGALALYEPRGKPIHHWLFRIARNEALDRLRARDRARPEDPAVLAERVEGPAPEAARTDQALLSRIERLPQAQREVLVLRYALDLTPSEIAAVTGRSGPAVRQLHRRALTALRARGDPSSFGRCAEPSPSSSS